MKNEGAKVAKESLEEFLARHNARLGWELDSSAYDDFVHPFKIQCYFIGGHTVMIQRWESDGWEVFMSATESNNIADTFEAIEKRTND